MKTLETLIKLDMPRYFDRINMKFIFHILKDFGFEELWIRWVMSLVTKYFFSIIVNGSTLYPFYLLKVLDKETQLSPSRGIKQGDIFLLMEKGLVCALKLASM